MIRRFNQLILLFMMIAASPAFGDAVSTEEGPACKNPFFLGVDFPIEEIASWVENFPDSGTFHPIRLLQKTEDGFFLRSSYGFVAINYDFETDQIMQLGGNGTLPSWINEASNDLGPSIFSHFLNYILNVGGWQILDVKMSGMELEEISLFHGEGHEEIEACEAPNCGCVGVAKIYDFDRQSGAYFHFSWRR